MNQITERLRYLLKSDFRFLSLFSHRTFFPGRKHKESVGRGKVERVREGERERKVKNEELDIKNEVKD